MWKIYYAGSGNQYFNQPIYDGFQNAWVKEEISLNNYLGKNVKLRFRMVSDFGNSYDGFYIDDVEVVSNFANGINEANFIGNNISIMPNPFDDILYINTKVNIENATIELFNIQGQKVWNNVYTNVFGSIRINTKNITGVLLPESDRWQRICVYTTLCEIVIWNLER